MSVRVIRLAEPAWYGRGDAGTQRIGDCPCGRETRRTPRQGHFTLRCYVVDPRGRILAEASEDGDELVVADLDLDMVREVRNLWQFFRDRRPEMYGDLTEI